jgi:metallo-beta-lactamase family protein
MVSRRKKARPLDDRHLARITFLGAAQQVTGSHFLIETRRSRVVVDCGLHQGGRKQESRNRRTFASLPAQVDAVVLTHAHIDHSGLLPKYVRDGYAGEIHCTRGTRDLCGIMLRDSAHIQEVDAERISRRRRRRGARTLDPLYTMADAEACLERFTPHPFQERVELGEDVAVRFRRAGHILGASSIELWVRDEKHERKLVFSGDLGVEGKPLMRDPAHIDEADLVVMESTYGDRDPRDIDSTLEELAAILQEAQAGGDNVLIPVFAVGRAQEILFRLRELVEQGRIQPWPVYLDSPMAIGVTELYREHMDSLGSSLRASLKKSDRPLRPARFQYSRTADDSRKLNEKRGAIILAASGMCDAGRIQHHLKHNLWRDSVHVVIVGFQARGTTGRALVDGARRVRIMGQEVAVKARVHTLGGFSAHAGQSALLEWLGELGKPEVILVHGEADKQEVLIEKIREHHGLTARAPELGQELGVPRSGGKFELSGG